MLTLWYRNDAGRTRDPRPRQSLRNQLSTTVLAEATFALPGLGTLLRDSVLFKDIAVVQSLTLLVACVIMAISLLADSAYLLLDPRVREHGRRGS